MGRLYLPLQWLREAGVDPDAWLAKPVFNAAVASVVARVLLVAEQLYQRAGAGVAQLPLACRPGINAARYLYAEIGHEVARRGWDSVSQRAVVAPSRKAWLLAGAMLNLNPAPAEQGVPNLEATRFLVEAVAGSGVRRAAQTPPQLAWWQIGQRLGRRVEWTLDLFERLERQERQAHSVPARALAG